MDFETLLADSRLAFVNGQNEKALELAKQAIKLDSKNADAYQCAANACMTLEDYENAIMYYKEAVRCEPNNGNRFFNLGYALAASEKTADAVKALAKADELTCSAENAAQLYHVLGIICFDIGRYDDSLINLKKAEQIMGPDMDVMQRMSVIYGLKNDIINGIFTANQIKLIAPVEYTGYQMAFKFLCQAKRYNEAQKELKKAEKYAHISMDYYIDCMSYELELYNETKDKKHFENALEYIEKSLKILKPTVSEVVESYINSAEIYLQLENADKTIECLNASLNPIESYNNGFEIISHEYEEKKLTEYDVEEMMEADRTKLEEKYGPDGIEELAASVEPDENGNREYFTELEDELNDENEEEKEYKIDSSEKAEYSTDITDQINRLFTGAYTLKKDFEKVIVYAKKLQGSPNVHSIYMGKYTVAHALKEMNSSDADEKYNELIKYLRNALLKDPTDLSAVTYRIQCLADVRKYDEAEEVCSLLSNDMKTSMLEKIKEAKTGGEE